MRYYVYWHRHPLEGGIVYVGKGCGGRAWDTSRNRKFCHPDHYEWILDLLNQGFTPQDYVVIGDQNLSQEDAFTKEKEFTHANGQPRFNRMAGERNHKAKLTDSQARDIYLSKEQHHILAEIYGVSRSAISMIKSGKQWRAATACLRN